MKPSQGISKGVDQRLVIDPQSDRPETRSPNVYSNSVSTDTPVKSRQRKVLLESFAFLIALSASLMIAAEFDLFEMIVEFSRDHEEYELDEIFSALILMSVFLLIFSVRRILDLEHIVDHTELSEQRHRREWTRLCDAIEAVDAGFSLWDIDDRLIWCNSRYQSMFGDVGHLMVPGVRFEDLIRQHYDNLEPTGATSALVEQLNNRILTHRHGGSIIVRDPRGDWIRCDDHRAADGGTVSLRTDINELKQREFDLEQAALQAEEQAQDMSRLAAELTEALRTADNLRLDAESANLAKSRFLATMSHELRTPLNAIIGFSEIIKDRAFGSDWTEQYFSYAADIHESGIHLIKIINEILDLSKIEAGNLELQRHWIDFTAVRDQCIRLIKTDMTRKGIRFHSEDAPASSKFYADERSVKQIIFNLLSNAVKYTPNGGEIRVDAGRDTGGGFLITVSDTGVGIPEDQIPRLFRPFERMDDGYTCSSSGTGLGLSIVERLMDCHGGRVAMESRIDHGTTVTLWFPDPTPRVDTAAGVGAGLHGHGNVAHKVSATAV